ncbi:MAG: hypothetical protein K2X57_00670 [Xanthobacteraceae bacterium]|nr:hypothetical protein [Xanthobacteraceae bacterium]
MHHSGFAGRVPDRPEERAGSFWMSVNEQFLRGAPALATTFNFPNGETISFVCPRAQIDELLPSLNADIQTALKSDLNDDEICSNLHDVGRRLRDCLLVSDPATDTNADRQLLARLFRQHDSFDLQCQVHLPIPLELLVFDAPVGVGPFARMMGGRANTYFVSRSRPGRPAGKGASFFHDNTADTVRQGYALAALQSAFGHKVDKHVDLERGKLSEVQSEIDRLFKNAKSAWAHFQCHVEYPAGQPNQKMLQLSRQFLAGPDRFKTASTAIAGIFLNGCGATNILKGQTDLQSSWGEHFVGMCFVPSVIGPFCAVPDVKTLPFTQAFYARLAADGDVYASFVSAKRSRLASTDCTALTYRYIGPRTLKVPLDAPPAQLEFFDPAAEFFDPEAHTGSVAE